ncbi:MAG: hypothetical protein ACR2OA_14310 [Rubripirellula sp.]|jgi:hypothetical protein
MQLSSEVAVSFQRRVVAECGCQSAPRDIMLHRDSPPLLQSGLGYCCVRKLIRLMDLNEEFSDVAISPPI